MITLVRKDNDSASDEIEQRLKDLVLAYKTETVETGTAEQTPYINENGNAISGKQLDEWFRELEEELTWQRSLTGDACYLDPETGKPC